MRDVSEAYRCIPIAPNQWPGTVLRISDSLFAVNVALLFGLTSSGGIWGLFADALCAILRASGIAPLAKWVDDFIFFRILLSHLDDYNRRQKKWAERIRLQGGCRQTNSRIWFAGGFYPDGTIEEYDNDLSNPILPQASSIRNEHLFTYSLDDIDDITEPLGIPWSKPKEIPFCSRPEYIGFYWDIDKRMVGLTEKKKEKYRKAIDEWRTSSTHDLPETQKLYGKLLHAAHIIPAGRAYLTVFENFMGIFGDSPHMPRTPRKSIFADLDWWYERLSKPSLERRIPGPVNLIDLHAYSDASSSVGIGLVVQGAWRAWKLRPGWKSDSDGRDIAWIEALGVEILFRSILPSLSPSSHVKVYCDNKVVVEGWRVGRSRNQQVNRVFKRLHQLCEDSQCNLHVRYVQGRDNPADGPSRGVYPKGPLLAVPALPNEITQYLQIVTENEIREPPLRTAGITLPKPHREEKSLEDDHLLDEIGLEVLKHHQIWEDDVFN